MQKDARDVRIAYYNTLRINDMDVLLMLCTILAVVLLVVVLVNYLSRIIALLDHIGGKGDSYLAKLRLGLRLMVSPNLISRSGPRSRMSSAAARIVRSAEVEQSLPS